LMTSRKYRASRPHVGKADPALSLTGTCNGSVRSYPRQAHSPNPHSNKRPTKPNPAISRLSASPTPGNVPRHSNGAHVASEKPTPLRTFNHTRQCCGAAHHCSHSCRAQHLIRIKRRSADIPKPPFSNHCCRNFPFCLYSCETGRIFSRSGTEPQLRLICAQDSTTD
jgi:hypothetical protein